QRTNAIEPLDVGLTVQAVIAARPGRRSQQTRLLVVMQSADGHARRLRELAYAPSTLAHVTSQMRAHRARYNLTLREVQVLTVLADARKRVAVRMVEVLAVGRDQIVAVRKRSEQVERNVLVAPMMRRLGRVNYLSQTQRCLCAAERDSPPLLTDPDPNPNPLINHLVLLCH